MFTKSITATFGIILLPLLFSMSGVQDDVDTTDTQESNVTQLKDKITTSWRRQSSGGESTRIFGLASRRNSADQKIKEAAKALRQAKTSDDQDDAREELSDLLDADYDSRLAEYEAYLDSMEKQLQEMRDKLTKRRDAKAKMIDLRIKVLEAEADDLGWPSRMNTRWGFPARLNPLSTSSGGAQYEEIPRPVQPAQPVPPARPAQPAARR